MINFGQKCLLCNNAIDTPKHLFERCEVGNMLRAKRDIIFSKLNFENISLNEDERTYCMFRQNEIKDKVMQYLVTVSNYSIFRVKMKKFYDRQHIITNEEPLYIFLNRIKIRITCDHKRLNYNNFKEIWAPHNNLGICLFNENKILQWLI